MDCPRCGWSLRCAHCNTLISERRAAPDLLAACEAAIKYDAAIRGCANEPEKMATFCTARGDTLDTLYAEWVTLARAAIANAERTTE